MNTILKMVLVVGFFLLASVDLRAQTQRPLLKPTTRLGTLSPKRDESIVRSRNVLVDIQLLRTRRILVPLFDGTVLSLVRERVERFSRRGFVWYGKVAGQPGSFVMISAVGKVVVGNVMTQDGKTYHIRYIGNEVHSVRQIDQSKLPNEGEPLKPKEPEGPRVSADTCATDPPTDIDVMVVYTGDARTAAGGSDAMEALIYLAIAETNQSYLNSQITQRLRLAHFAEVSYTESGDMETDLRRLTNLTDGFMDNVLELRNRFAADHVVLITEDPFAGLCGLAWIMTTVSNDFERSAYAVVRRSCATGNFTFGHELGHNMGADHDTSTVVGAFVFNHGHVNLTPTSPALPWRTLMAVNGNPSSNRVLFWSSPNINFPPGDPMGVEDVSDNHRVLNNTALTVANFRCSSPAVGNVWMKDTWNDTGVEPDPLTASERMWRSPYIWVRNTQDTNRVNQHQHQNPEAGSSNWVYVKIHNGFSETTSGNLELYWTRASTGVIWPEDWSPLATIPVSSFEGHSTKIVEALWKDTPGPGHFCLLARWASDSDAMTTRETSDIYANVRANNNLIWRNLNIVDLLTPDSMSVNAKVRARHNFIGRNLNHKDLPADGSGNAEFIVRNVTKGERLITSLAIRPAGNKQEDSFTSLGLVIVRLDEGLMKAWRRGGAQGKGFKFDGSNIIVTDPRGAVLQAIVLEPSATGYVKLTFKRQPRTPKRTFLIDVIQGGATKRGKHKVIGGVSYEIHTDRPPKKL